MPKTAFARTEYIERIVKTKTCMETKGIDLFIVAQPENMLYLSGYANQTYPFLGFVIIASDEEEPLWVGRESTDQPAARLTTFMSDDRFVGYPETCHSGAQIWRTDSGDTVETFLANVLAERGWDKRRIGLEFEAPNISTEFVQCLQRLLPQSTIIPADGLCASLRVVKSPQEIDYIRQAGVITERAMQIAIESITEGVRQCDTAAAVYQALVAGTPEYGGQQPYMEFTVGERGPAIRSFWTDAPYRKGELACLELFGRRFGYEAGLTRSISVGKPSDFVANMMAVVVEAMNEAYEHVRPGVTYGQVGEVLHAVITKHGFEARHGLGYSFNDWGDDGKAAWLAPGDDMILAPNHTIHMLPVMRMENGDWGLSMSTTLRVTETGPAEHLTLAPSELIVKV
ncbi:MAG: Xaa-Pro peptidase family protein [Pseudomonadota bacterium]